MLRPLVCRTWALRGQTPIVRCWDRRDRLSVTAAIIMPAARRRHQLAIIFRIQDRNVKAADTLAFLRALDRHVRGPLIVVMDRLSAHRAAARRWLAGRARDGPRAVVEWLPAYAPELNPVELIWSHGKRRDLANLAASDTTDLRRHMRRSLIGQRHRPNLLASFFDHAGLAL